MSPTTESPTTAENLLHSTIYTLFGVRYSVFDIRYFLTPNTEHRISNTKPNVGVNIPYTPSEDANNGQNNSNYELKHPRQPHTVLPHPNTPVFQRHMLPKLLR
ncbi:MAG TPA: hypothetical protein PLM41_22105, partial [Saprospiraceae bacterium]|nr:hypothetical protein [Saprospiraceae bacterium]